jgi:hypothetical protein
MATKLIKFRPYTRSVVHDPKPTYAPQRTRFSYWMLKNVRDGLVDAQLLFITDEAYLLKRLCKFSENTNLERRKTPRSSPDTATRHKDSIVVCCMC